MPIAVYTGALPRVGIELRKDSTAFDRGVPSYIPQSRIKAVLERTDMAEYEPGSPAAQGRPIYITLPTKNLEWFLPCLLVIQKIKSVYPTCPVEVQAGPFAGLLSGSGVRPVQVRTSGVQYYRDFNLSESALFSGDLGRFHAHYQPWFQYILSAIGMYDLAYSGAEYRGMQPTGKTITIPGDDLTAGPKIAGYGDPESGTVLLLKTGGNDRTTVTNEKIIKGIKEAAAAADEPEPEIETPQYPFGDLLERALESAGWNVKTIEHETDILDALADFKTAAALVCCGGSPLLYLGAACGLEVMYFDPPPPFSMALQYDGYANVTKGKIQGDIPAIVAARVAADMGGVTKKTVTVYEKRKGGKGKRRKGGKGRGEFGSGLSVVPESAEDLIVAVADPPAEGYPPPRETIADIVRETEGADDGTA